MPKVINIIESDIKTINGRTVQRIIFSNNSVVYVDVETGEVRPDSTPDKYVDLISSYNASHQMNKSLFDEYESNDFTDIISQPRTDSSIRAAAILDLIAVFIYGVVGIIALGNGGAFIIVLAWTIPMTMATFKAAEDGEDHTALGICHLFFFNLISGILILASRSGKER